MLTPKVSVILPCYNMELFLSESLDSVLSQTLSEIEVICVNDGSTDSTLNILQAYQQKDPRITIIDQENQGVAAARNVAIHSATGEYIAFMDPDDFYPDAHTLELLYTKASGNNALICGGSLNMYYHDENRMFSDHKGIYEKFNLFTEGFIDYFDYQFDFGFYRFLYKRSLLLENNIFFPPYARFQDPPFFIRAMIAAGSFYSTPQPTYVYRRDFQEPRTSWSSIKIQDMLRGHLDDLNISAQHNLSELHALTVKRLDVSDVVDPVMVSLQAGNEKTLALLLQISQAIRPELLQEAGMKLNAAGGYTLRVLRQALREVSGARATRRVLERKEKEIVSLTRKLNDTQNSVSYRIGGMITLVPRKLRGVVRCCKDHGVFYTVTYAAKRIRRKLCKTKS